MLKANHYWITLFLLFSSFFPCCSCSCTTSTSGEQANELADKTPMVLGIFFSFSVVPIALWMLAKYYNRQLQTSKIKPLDSEDKKEVDSAGEASGDSQSKPALEYTAPRLWTILHDMIGILTQNDEKLWIRLLFFPYWKSQHELYALFSKSDWTRRGPILQGLLIAFGLSVALGSISASQTNVACSTGSSTSTTGPSGSSTTISSTTSSSTTDSGSGSVEYGEMIFVVMGLKMYWRAMYAIFQSTSKVVSSHFSRRCEFVAILASASFLITIVMFRNRYDEKWDIGAYFVLFISASLVDWFIFQNIQILMKWIIGSRLQWPIPISDQELIDFQIGKSSNAKVSEHQHPQPPTRMLEPPYLTSSEPDMKVIHRTTEASPFCLPNSAMPATESGSTPDSPPQSCISSPSFAPIPPHEQSIRLVPPSVQPMNATCFRCHSITPILVPRIRQVPINFQFTCNFCKTLNMFICSS